MTEYVPKVAIKSFSNKRTWSLASNLSQSQPCNDKHSVANKLLRDLREYQQYCIGMIEHGSLPFMGKHFTGSSIENYLLPFLRKNSISTGDYSNSGNKETNEVFLFDVNDAARVKNTLDKTLRLLKISDSLSEAVLGSIVGTFEFYIKKSIEHYSKTNKEKFINVHEDVKIGKILEYGDLNSIIEERINHKIQEKMRGSHESIIQWIAELFESGDLSAITKSDTYKDFMEACQRRHILIHNGGIVNDLYIRKCLSFGLKKENLPDIGNKISVSPQYIKKVTGRSFLIVFYILHMYIQKNGTEEEKLSSLDELLFASHSFLLSKQTKMCLRVLDFAEKNKNIPNDTKIAFGINRALSFLFNESLPKEEQTRRSKETLKKYDLSVTNALIDLALACAKRDFKNIIDLAKKAYNQGVDYSTITTFVVFSEARKIDGFLECFPKPHLQITYSQGG